MEIQIQSRVFIRIQAFSIAPSAPIVDGAGQYHDVKTLPQVVLCRCVERWIKRLVSPLVCGQITPAPRDFADLSRTDTNISLSNARLVQEVGHKRQQGAWTHQRVDLRAGKSGMSPTSQGQVQCYLLIFTFEPWYENIKLASPNVMARSIRPAQGIPVMSCTSQKRTNEDLIAFCTSIGASELSRRRCTTRASKERVLRAVVDS